MSQGIDFYPYGQKREFSNYEARIVVKILLMSQGTEILVVRMTRK